MKVRKEGGEGSRKREVLKRSGRRTSEEMRGEAGEGRSAEKRPPVRGEKSLTTPENKANPLLFLTVNWIRRFLCLKKRNVFIAPLHP